MDEAVIHVSAQEHKMSSKYPLLEPPFLTHFRLKFSGYLHLGKKTSFMTSWMTLSSMSLVRNPERPPSTSLSTPQPDTLIINISLWNFQGIFRGVNHDHTLLIQISVWHIQGIFLRVKQDHPWHQGWPCPPCILSETFNAFLEPPLLT